jgi:hypothetical protein
MSQIVIGLGHRARAGKDSVANVLCGAYGFSRLSFAESLKAAACEIFGWDRRHVDGELKEVVDGYWGFSPRWALQHLGTEAVRRVIGDDTWIKSAMLRIRTRGPRVVITDVRFPNEADAILDLGGEVWRVDRPGLPPAEHASERGLLGYSRWSAVLANDGSLSDLESSVDQLVGRRLGL